MAIRLGYTLGLNSTKKEFARQEVLSRIWWAHVSLDRFMAVMTGYPSIVMDNIDLIPLPLALSSEEIDETIIETLSEGQEAHTVSLAIQRASTASAGTSDSTNQANPDYLDTHLEPTNSGSYQKKIVQLGKIAHDAVSMYAASTVGQTWQAVQEIISRLTKELESWATSLPDGLNFLGFRTLVQHQYVRERNTLDLLYHGTIIMVTRPCLCRLDRRASNRATGLNEFNLVSALTCVESAKAVARLLPESPGFDLGKLYEFGPWWTMAQIVMQSLVVLLLEISYEAVQLPHDRRENILLLKKLVRWLRAMNINNGMAKHAYLLVMSLLRSLVVTVKMVRTIPRHIMLRLANFFSHPFYSYQLL
jgi:hypothetical protein